MPYAQRNSHGEIVSLFRSPQPDATEYVEAGDAEVIAFLRGELEGDGFGRLDAGFVRVLEDLLDLMIERHLLILTDLPPEAQAKWLARKQLRAETHSAPSPLPDTGFADVIDDTGFGKL
ncbi:MAG: hypothetical protein KF788_20565 [Piscinibacter sp.]|nr:hypothetical protein [Piscinibacter sp.]